MGATNLAWKGRQYLGDQDGEEERSQLRAKHGESQLKRCGVRGVQNAWSWWNKWRLENWAAFKL